MVVRSEPVCGIGEGRATARGRNPLWCEEPVVRLARAVKVSPFVASVNRGSVSGEHVWQDLPVTMQRRSLGFDRGDER
jgi:hypothetical protein